jgi:hypothetical protein
MQQDQPPANRAARRSRGKGTKTVFLHQAAKPDSPAAKRQRASLSQNTLPYPDTGISNGFGAVADVAPENMPAGDMSDDASNAAVFQGYRGKYGLLKTNIVTSYATVGMLLGGPSSPDGILFLSTSESIADAWIAWGKADPRYMRIVQLVWGGPFMTLMLAHAPLIGGMMANHGVHMPKLLNPLQMPMFKGLAMGGQNATGAAEAAQSAAGSDIPALDPFTANYHPAGPTAPTENPGPPPSVDTEAPLRVYPDEGIPADVEAQLRQVAQQYGVPYAQIRDQYLLETAQDRIARNSHINPPAALGVPVTQPGA